MPDPCPICSALTATATAWLGPPTVAPSGEDPLWQTIFTGDLGLSLVPSAHLATLSALSAAQQAALWPAIEAAKRRADPAGRVSAWTVAIDEAPPAPAEAAHLRVRLFPAEPLGLARLSDGVEGETFGQRLRAELSRAVELDVVVAFLRLSGLLALRPALLDALRRGLRVRVITGDYLGITQPEALTGLLDLRWAAAPGLDDEEPPPSPAFGEPTEAEATEAEAGDPSRLALRIIETTALGGRSFHPKAWRLRGPGWGVAWVGSSNWSHEALHRGVEWNLRLDAHRDPEAWARVEAAFSALWARARPIDPAWISAYAARRGPDPGQDLPRSPPDPSGGDQPLPLPAPNSVQAEALAALSARWDSGAPAALVVMATGLGKTLLAVMALVQRWRPGWRLLWVAHRRELLSQAGEALRRGLPHLEIGLAAAGADPAVLQRGGPDVVLGSIQTVGRADRLAGLPIDAFDVVVVDEVHHASALSYRRLLAHLQPRLRLGLTATPDRSDGADILRLFDDAITYRADLGLGVLRGLLVPFRYFGLRDTIDYTGVPWRNGRFDTEALCAAAETQARMDKLWEAWGQADRAGRRTLVFCAAVRHADFVGAYLRARGLRLAVCHGSAGADDRDAALAGLRAGDLDCIVSVDLFNEGLDCPPVDRVVMLRPTESAVMFLQQLGRGLRTHPDKRELVVIDFVGNHALFLRRLDALLSAAGADPGGLLDRLDSAAKGEGALPPGCSVALELEVVELLRHLLPKLSEDDPLRAAFRELRALRGQRPAAGDLVRRGWSLRRVHAAEGGWCAFLRTASALTEAEGAAQGRGAAALSWVEGADRAELQALVLLQRLLEAPPGPAPLVGPDPEPDALRRLRAARLLAPGAPLRLAAADDGPLCALLAELTDARLAALRRGAPVGAPTRLRVLPGPALVVEGPNQGDPTQSNTPQDGPLQDWPLQDGELAVFLPDGRPARLRWAAGRCVDARWSSSQNNALQAILDALDPTGSPAALRLSPSPDGWWLSAAPRFAPAPTALLPLPGLPTLRAAAGFTTSRAQFPEVETVYLPGPHPRGALAVRVCGDSMAGGARPLFDGDWAILQPCRGLGLGTVEGEVALVALGPEDEGQHHHLKRVVRGATGHLLRSDAPGLPDRAAEDCALLARLRGVVRPEDLGPAPGAVVEDPALALGLPEPLPALRPGAQALRLGGHLLLLDNGPDLIQAPDRWALRVPDRQPSEPAHLFARLDGGWLALGIGRWTEDEGDWAFAAPTLAQWRAIHPAGGVSRTLPRAAEQRAKAAADAIAKALLGQPVSKGADGQLRVLGQTRTGSLRVEQGKGTRSVSHSDLAWCLLAEDEVRGCGGVLDEARVNRLRYLEGTAKESTRYIDTGNALALMAAWRKQLQ